MFMLRKFYCGERNGMKTSMEISLYPLKTRDIGPTITKFISILEADGCSVEPGSMSTLIVGENDLLFNSLRRAYEAVASENSVVVIVKISNACPV